MDETIKQKAQEERRKKLAQWRAKKTQVDAQKKTPSVKENPKTENGENTTSLQEERQNKLKEWRKKLDINRQKSIDKDNEEQNLATRSTNDLNSINSTKKRNRTAKRGINFLDSDVENTDAETSRQPKKLFRPTVDDRKVDEGDIPGKQNDKQVELDSLDSFISKLESHTNVNPIAKSTTNKKIISDNEDDINNILPSNSKAIEDDDTYDEAPNFKVNSKLKALRKVKGIDYANMKLVPIKKDFFVSLSGSYIADKDVERLQHNIENIRVTGGLIPKPILRWSQLGLTSNVTSYLTENLNFKIPTPIQAQAIPAIMTGKDIIGISKTGSGKTIAYILPMLRHIHGQSPLLSNESGPIGLILAPTRELALQINSEVNNFIQNDSLNSICCAGGSDLKKQINSIKKGVYIIVATPGRFIDLLTLNSGKLIDTTRISFVVMDEADRLFDMGFEPQISQIMQTIRPDKHTILFSATFPKKLKKFAMRTLIKPLTITVASDNMINENIEQKFIICENDSDKFEAMVNLLEKYELDNMDKTPDLNKKLIIFVSSQQICELLYNKLENVGYSTFMIHAGKPYAERVQNLHDFKSTPSGILLCTEVLSRGLNVPETSIVIIYNAVKTFAQYVHTVGRTGRGSNRGTAISLLLEDEKAAAFILSRAMKSSEIQNHSSQQQQLLKTMTTEFDKGMNKGEYKLQSGFGGKGLDHLDEKREMQERVQFEQDKDYPKVSLLKGKGISETKPATQGSDLSSKTDDSINSNIKLRYSISKGGDINGAITFMANINVNDLPQIVRWEVTKNTTLMSVKHETGCSITMRGKFYPEGKEPSSPSDEPKLYLLVEASNEKDIILCIELLEGYVKSAVRKIEFETAKSNKF